MPIDEEEMRAWMNERRLSAGLSWKAISEESGIPQGSISPWATGTYQGNGQNIAKKVYKYWQTLETQAARAAPAQNAGLSNEPDSVEQTEERRVGKECVSKGRSRWGQS